MVSKKLVIYICNLSSPGNTWQLPHLLQSLLWGHRRNPLVIKLLLSIKIYYCENKDPTLLLQTILKISDSVNDRFFDILKVSCATFGAITMFKEQSLSFHLVSKTFITQNYLVFIPSNIYCFSVWLVERTWIAGKHLFQK